MTPEILISILAATVLLGTVVWLVVHRPPAADPLLEQRVQGGELRAVQGPSGPELHIVRRRPPAEEAQLEGTRPPTPEPQAWARAQRRAVNSHPLHLLIHGLVEAKALELPLLPSSAGRILAMCGDESVRQERLAEAIESDPTLTAHVLRIANSALYAPNQRITSLPLAIMRLGQDAVRDITMSVTLHAKLMSGGSTEAASKTLLHSAVASGFAHALAPLASVDEAEAGLAALLHDIGRPALRQACVELKNEIEERTTGEVIRVCLEDFHERVGGDLIRMWNFPESIATAVEHHHHPDTAPSHRRLVLVTALADRVARWSEEDDPDPEEMRAHPHARALGIRPEEMDRVLRDSEGIRRAAAAYLV